MNTNDLAEKARRLTPLQQRLLIQRAARVATAKTTRELELRQLARTAGRSVAEKELAQRWAAEQLELRAQWERELATKGGRMTTPADYLKILGGVG